MKKALRKIPLLVPLLFVLFLSQFMYSSGFQSGEYIGQIQSRYRSSLLTEQVLKIAHNQVGVKERKNNRGDVEKYQRSVGLAIGSPYCYAGIYWCFDSASKITGRKNYLLKTGLASAGRKHLQKISDNSRSVSVPALIFWQYPKTMYGHVEIAFEFYKANWVRCVGFNTGGNNPREGGGVKYTYRNYNHPLVKMFVKSIIVL